MARAGYEPVKLERQERSFALTATLVLRTARQHQKCLQLRLTAGDITSRLIGQPPGSICKRCRLASRESLPIRQTNLKLAPDSKRVATQCLIIQGRRQVILDRVDERWAKGRRFES